MGRQTVRELPAELQLSTSISEVYNSKKPNKLPERDPDNTPANSRLFVVCGRDMTEQQLLDLFGPYGKIEYCRVIRDKKSQESKGLCYIKYSKASSAADALENIDGTQLKENGPFLKVHIADAKGTTKSRRKLYSSEPEDTPPRSRLFVVCPKEMTEEMLNERFKQIDGLEYCKVIADKQTGESKGFAYVKFNKASSAALAMESVSESAGEIAHMKVKVLIADPKNKRNVVNNDYLLPPVDNMYPYGLQIPYLPPFIYPYPPMIKPRVSIFCHTSVTVDELSTLFLRYHGFEYCEIDPQMIDYDSSEPYRCGYAYFSHPQSAIVAAEQLDGHEFPPGYTFKCAYEPLVMSPLNNSPPDNSFIIPPHLIRHEYGNLSHMYPHMMGYPPYCGEAQIQTSNEIQGYPSIPVRFTCSGQVNENQIATKFADYGPIEKIELEKDNLSGCVYFVNYNSCQMAVRDLDGAEVDGHFLQVNICQ